MHLKEYMRIKLLFICNILIFTFTSNLRADSSFILEISKNSAPIIKKLFHFNQKNSSSELLVFNKDQQDELIDIYEDYYNETIELKSKFKNDYIIVSNSKKTESRIAAKILFFGLASEFLTQLTESSASYGLFHQLEAEFNKERVLTPREIYELTIREAFPHQLQKSRLRDRDQPIFRLANFLLDKEKYKQWLLNSRFTTEERVILTHYLETYEQNIGIIYKNYNEKLNGKLFSDHLYAIKVKALYYLGLVALPKKNTFDIDQINELQEKLEPGDIAVVNRDGRLSNVVFQGTWSHGLLYLGDNEKLKNYFNQDNEVSNYYSSLCKRERLDCDNFYGYLENKYPDDMSEFNTGQYSVIEAVGSGVQFSKPEVTFSYNRITAMRPKLSKLEKAMAIDEAISNLHKPYDYNFDNRTYDRLVCTELIMYSYMPKPSQNKKGMDFFINMVHGNPAMYGYDMVKTLFKYNQMDFILYWEGPTEQKSLQKLTIEDLRRTVYDN